MGIVMIIQSIFHNKSCLVFGCGNPLFGDDGFGPEVISFLESKGELPSHVACLDVGTSIRDILFNLLLDTNLPHTLIIVDAVEVQGREPGDIFIIRVDDIAKEIDGQDLIDILRFGYSIEPIPLTEEWLIKMGFEKHNSYYLSPNKSSVEGFVDILCFDLENLSFIVDMSEYSGWTVDCKFVHTLQNLYYALTNEELTINN
jgi:Ni,Fe-hydrogenase maturation factor